MPYNKPETKDSFQKKIFRLIVKDTGFDPELNKQDLFYYMTQE